MGTFSAGTRGKCPHCRTTVLFEVIKAGVSPILGRRFAYPLQEAVLGAGMQDSSSRLILTVSRCPNCKQPIMTVEAAIRAAIDPRTEAEDLVGEHDSVPTLIWPPFIDREVPQGVPEHIAQDYQEATIVLTLSPKASAALSRRCLQTVLRENGHTQHDLSKQIDSALPTLPQYIATNVDAVRNIGNFAAHQQKSTASGEILGVEPGEAEWNLDVLDDLFDFYYTKPAQANKKREALNQRLSDAGKPPMK